MKSVIFDMDGVIFDSERCIIECWKKVAEKYGLEDIVSVAYRCLGINAKASEVEFRKAYGEDFDYMTIKDEMFDLFRREYIEKELPKKKGVNEILEFLKQNGFKVALATSTKRELVIKELTAAGIIQYFDAIVCGDQVQRSKPYPDIYLKAAEMINADIENTFAIEDSYNGIRSAHSAGLKTIMVPDLLPATIEITDLCDTVQPSLIEAMEYIKKNTNK